MYPALYIRYICPHLLNGSLEALEIIFEFLYLGDNLPYVGCDGIEESAFTVPIRRRQIWAKSTASLESPAGRGTCLLLPEY
jgi:hypothetical protein